MAAISQKYLSIRYSILPFYYTTFFRATVNRTDNYMFDSTSGMVLTPMFVAFPRDKQALLIDKQFLVGGALLISPQLEIGQ